MNGFKDTKRDDDDVEGGTKEDKEGDMPWEDEPCSESCFSSGDVDDDEEGDGNHRGPEEACHSVTNDRLWAAVVRDMI